MRVGGLWGRLERFTLGTLVRLVRSGLFSVISCVTLVERWEVGAVCYVTLSPQGGEILKNKINNVPVHLSAQYSSHILPPAQGYCWTIFESG